MTIKILDGTKMTASIILHCKNPSKSWTITVILPKKHRQKKLIHEAKILDKKEQEGVGMKYEGRVSLSLRGVRLSAGTCFMIPYVYT